MDDFTDEHWLPVPGYAGLYEVSDYGRVQSLPRNTTRGGILKLSLRGPKNNLRPSVRLSRNNVARNCRVHRLVLLAFAGEPPPGTEACHRDDDRMNNRLSNLRWDTPKANGADKVRNGKTWRSRTRCKYGHEWTPQNTRYDKRGTRWCIECGHRRAKESAVRRSRARRAARSAAA